MNANHVYDIVEPRIVRCRNGQWLAFSPKRARFCIGVTASTEAEANQKFRSVYNEWIELRDTENT